MVWDLEKKTYITKIDGKDACQSLDWDFFGNTLCGVFKDKCLRVMDPRQETVALESTNSHKGNKSSRALWLSGRNQPSDSGNFIVTCGFSNQAKREMFLWDTRKFEKPIWTNNIDDNSGVIYPYFDECTGLLFLVGRGDGNIRYYEFADSSIFYINDHRSTTPQRGFCLYPKRVVEKDKNEIVKCLKLENTCIQTLSFCVPRRADVGSADLYPPCPNGQPAIPSVDSWLIRGDAALVPPSMDGIYTPGASPRVSVAPAAISPLTNSNRTNILPPPADSVMCKHTDEEFKQLKHQLAAAHKQVEEQQNKIQRLENIVMSVQEPALSPPPRRPQTMEQLEAMEELKMEVTILKEKVVKLMNENARLRMNFSSVSRPVANQPSTIAQVPAPPPIHPIARSPIRPPPTMGL
jgi:coronin-1B/1C/6